MMAASHCDRPPRRSSRPLRPAIERSPGLSIIVPVLDEALHIGATLQALKPLREAGHEVIVVDGGSADDTCRLARAHADRVVTAARGRAAQMNVGARLARFDTLLFLHADTLLPHGAGDAIAGAVDAGARWGRFDVRIVGRSPLLPIVATLMNLRSRLTGIATGDQAIFVQASDFERVGGFPEQSLMEDIELSRRLKRLSFPTCLPGPVRTSGRRWDRDGAWRTVVLMWCLRWRYWRGESPGVLARDYAKGSDARVR